MRNALDFFIAEAIEPMPTRPEDAATKARALTPPWAQWPTPSQALAMAAADARRLARRGATKVQTLSRIRARG
jgi:hypothetical protein